MSDLGEIDPVPLLRGHRELERTARGWAIHRLPAAARAQCPDPALLVAQGQPAGVRLAMRTTAQQLELDVVATKREYVGAGRRPDGLFQLDVDGEVVAERSVPDGDLRLIDMATGAVDVTPGPVGTVRFADLPVGEKDVTLWLPHDETVEIVALRADAPVAPSPGRRTWLHHGSSISQGSNAGAPTRTWPVVAARLAGVDLVNLGFSGQALLDQFTARAIRDTPADLISLKIGINLTNTDLMRRRALGPAMHGFLDTIRDGHPTTPLVLVTPLHCAIQEATPGPAMFDMEALARGEARFVSLGDPAEVAAGRLTLQVIREVLTEVVTQRVGRGGDPHLRLVDGLELYGEADEAAHPLPDALHLGDEAHALVGRRFADLVL